MMAVEAARRLPRRHGLLRRDRAAVASPPISRGRRTRPARVLVYESGTIGAKPTELPLSIGDGELAETADVVVSVPEMFGYWLRGGRIDVGFLGAAQIDRFGNLNSTVIGDYDAPDGAAARCRRRARDRDRCARGVRDAPPDPARVRRASSTSGRASAGASSVVVTDLGLLEPRGEERELTLTHVHPGVERRAGARGDRLAVARRRRSARDSRRRPRTSSRLCAACGREERA